jgi:O-antigen ligase
VTKPALATSVFVAVAALTAPVAVIAPNGLAVLLALAGTAAALFDPAARRMSDAPRWLRALLAAFALVALASLLWTLDRAEGFDGWIRVCMTAALGLMLVAKARKLDDSARRRVSGALLGGYLAALVLVGLQVASQRVWDLDNSIAALWYPPETNFWALFNRSATVLALVLPLVAHAAYRRYGVRAALALAGVGIFSIFQLNSLAAEIAVAVGTAGAVCAAIAGRHSPRVLAMLLVGLMLAAPFAARSDALAELAARRDISVSIYHRAAIWGFSAARIEEKPLLGWGMHAARAMPDAKHTIVRGAELMPLHPHNGPLHLWLEFGALGALLGAGLLAGLALSTGGSAASRMSRTALLLAALVVASISYGLWQGWWMATLWLSGAFAAALPDDAQAQP